MADGLDISGFSNPQLEKLKLKHQLALAMLKDAGDTSAVASPWQALSRAISPLIGALSERSVNKEYGGLSEQANPELAALAQSDNPLAAISASKNPLIQALLPQIAQMQIMQGFHARGAGADEAATQAVRQKFAPTKNPNQPFNPDGTPNREYQEYQLNLKKPQANYNQPFSPDGSPNKAYQAYQLLLKKTGSGKAKPDEDAGGIFDNPGSY